MARPFGNRTAWVFGYYPQHCKSPGRLRLVRTLYTASREAARAAERTAGTLGCEVTPPLKVTVEIPEGVKR